jgi:cell envelope opacity-associated protein A
MVRPTVTKDVPACNNRFAVLDETYAAYQIRRALQDTSGKDPPPPSVQGAASLLAQSADARETADPSSKGHQPRVTHTQVLQGRIKHIRERSSSIKRKGSDHNSVPQKTARIEAEECPPR